jgi:hypothetical protein
MRRESLDPDPDLETLKRYKTHIFYFRNITCKVPARAASHPQ